MSFNNVHDIQKAYRKVIQCYSQPGKILSLKEDCEAMPYDTSLNKGVLIFALMVLDREVSYTVVSEEKRGHYQCLSQLTYAQIDEKEGDYLFLLKDGTCQDVKEALAKSKIGNLIDPQKSATVIIEVDTLENRANYSLSGPGIHLTNEVYLPLEEELIALREDKNKEFPLGVDLLLIDQAFNVMALPRTTKISGRGV